MKVIITAVIFFLIGRYWEKISDWWGTLNPSNEDKLGDN